MTTLAWVVRLGRPVGPRLALAMLAGVGAATAAVGLTATSAWLISRAAEQPPVLDLLVAIVGVRAFGVARGALRYAERLAAHDAAFRVLAELRSVAYVRLERLAPAGLAEFRSGDLLARVVGDVDGLADVWLRLLLPYSIAAAVAGGAVLLVGALAPLAGAALATTLLVVAIGAPLAAGKLSARAERRIAPARGELSAATLDLLEGAQELVVAGATERRLAVLATLDSNLRQAESRSAAGAGVGALVAGLAAGAAVLAALVVGALAVRSGSLPGVALAVVVLTPIAAHELVAGLAPAAQQLPRLEGSARRVAEILARPDPVAEPRDPVALPAGPYGLHIHDLHARYAHDGPDVLHGIDLELDAGQLALVTGPSGSGKTTLAAVLLRFLDPSAGSIELAGSSGSVDLTRLAADDVRRVVGVCSQDTHVFDTTIAVNVRLARPDASDAELAAALDSARLTDWIRSLPAGVQTPVGEHGAHLSGGQRQRLGLARTLLADRPIVIYDEPTEHLDEAAAAELTADLVAASAGRTVLVITHRPALMGAIRPAVTLELG